MADCEYQIAGDDRIYSESEFKKLLSEGYLDKVMLEKQIKVRGIKPNEELAKSFQLPSAVKPVAPIEPVTKAEGKVTEPTADDRVAEEYAKSTNSDIEAAKKSISDVEKYNNGEMSPKEYLESKGYSEKNFFEVGADREIKDFSDLTEEEFKEVADRTANYANNRINEIKQKVQAEPVTEPTVEEQDKVAEKAGVTPKNFRDLYKVNRELFGLDRLKSFTNAIAMDRMIGTMARRAGVDKSEMYGRLQFEKDTEENVLKAENALFQGVVNGENVNLKNVDVDVVNGFYSNTEKALSQVKQEKMSGNQWATQLLSRGANKEEMSWTGLQDYLKENASNSISKSDINQFLKDNRINIVEILKSEDGKLSSFYTDPDESNEKLDFLSSLDKDNLFVKQVTGGKWNIYSKSTPQRAILMGINSENEANDIILNPEKYKGREPIGRTKYSGYQLEGQKENYKEILITMPDKMDAVKDYNLKLLEYNNFVKSLGVPTQQEKDQANEMQSELDALKLKLPKNVSYQQGFAYVNEKFKSSHFDEPNILVHLRMNTRIDSDGKKVLFIEEVQSDWGQQGKKQGFGESERLKKTRVNLSEAKESLAKANEKLIEANKSGDEYDKKWYSNSVEKWGELINNYEKQIESLENTNRDNTPTAPFVTDTNAWTKLGLKVALKQAVNQGADRIAWTTGEQQNERYDLRKQVDEVNYYKTEDGRYHITADKDGISISSGIYKENELEGILGKEVAKKIIDNEGENVDKYNSAFGYDEFGSNQKYKSLKGENLAIGGKGMKGFYGSPKEGSLGIVGNVIKGLTKQEPKTVEIDAGGEKIGKATKDFDDLMQSLQFEKELQNNGKKGIVSTVNKDGSYTVEWNENNPSTQYSIDITPEIKADVQKGLALFQKEQGKKAKGAMVAADSSFVIYALTDPNVSTPLHELAHVYEHYLTDSERNKILKAAGTDTWNTKTSEYFARGFEKYLAEGKSPVESLNKVFDKFKEWLTDIYSGIKGSEIDVKLNKDMKAIYDTILKEGETKPKTETKQPEKEVPFEISLANKIAEAIRKGKTEEGAIKSNILGPLWDNTFEAIAQVVEKGGVEAYRIRQSIQKGINALKNNSAFKTFMDENPDEAKQVIDGYTERLKDYIYKKHNVDPTEDFGNVWDSSTKIVKDNVSKSDKSPEALQKAIDEGFKNVKESAWYNALDKEQRQQFAADYNEAMNRMFPIKEGKETVSKETISKEEKAKGKEFKEKVSQVTGTAKPEKTIRLSESELLRMQIKYGDKAGKKTIENLQDIKQRIQEYAEENLPKDSYSKAEVDKLMKGLSRAKTEKGLETALDKIDALVGKKLEKTRQQTIEEIIELTKPTSSKMIAKNRRTGARKGKISIDAQRQIREMRDQGLFDNDNLQSKTQEELDALKEQIKNIQEKGKAEKKGKTKAERQVKKSGEATILEALSNPNATLDTKEEILDFMNKYNGVVVINGQTMRKGEFEKYAKENPDDDYSGTNFYLDESADFKKQKEERKGTLKGFRQLTMGAIRDLDTYMKDISRGSKELRQWTQDNIINPTKIAIYNKVKNTAKFKGEYRDAVKNIFGRFNAGINYLSKDSGITTDVSGLEGVKPKKINRDQAVHIYGLINNPDKEKAQKNIDRLKSKNHIDTDKVKELVENDPKLMAYYEFLRDMYDKKFREEFGPTIEQLYEMPLDKGYYWPEPAGTSQSVELDLEGFSNKSISMIAPNMKHREPEYNGAFELVNSYDMYNRYVESMVHAKEFIPVIQNSRTLLSDINRPKILEKLKDANKYDDLVDLMKIIYTDKTPFKTTAMDKFANFVAVKSLWNRLKAVPQQASALINYYNAGWVDGINPLQIISSVVPTSKTELDFALDFYGDNPYLWQRFKGASNQDMKAIEANVETIVNQFTKKTVDVALFATLSPIKAGDFLATSTPLAGGAFAMAQFKKRLKENGNDYQEAKDFALRRWFEETERTQQPAIDKSIVSTTTYDPKYRFLIPFVSAQNSMGKKIVKAAKDIRDWKNLTQEEKTQAVADSLYYTVIGSIPFSLMSGSLLTLMDVFDEEDEEAKENMLQRVGFDLIADNVMSNIQSLYYVGFIMNGVLNEMRGRSYFNDRPQGETINSFLTFLASFAMADSDWDFLTEDMKKDYFNRFKLKGSELDEFNALTEEEKMDYLTNNAVKTGFIENTEESIEDFKKMYSEQSRVNRMGKKGMDAFLMFSGIDKPMNLYKDIARFMDGSGTFAELIYGEGAGTTVSAPPFSENIPNEFFKAISYKKDNQLFKYYSDFLGEPEEYYEIYPAKPGGPISSPAKRQNVNQGKEAVGRVRVRRKRPTRTADYDFE